MAAPFYPPFFVVAETSVERQYANAGTKNTLYNTRHGYNFKTDAHFA